MKKCKNAENYKGIHPPKCNGGNGCDTCWDIFYKVRKEKQKKCKHPPANLIADLDYEAFWEHIYQWQ